MTRLRIQCGLAAVSLLVIAACGGSDSNSSATTSASASTANTSVETSATDASSTSGPETPGSETPGSETSVSETVVAQQLSAGLVSGADDAPCTETKPGSMITYGVGGANAAFDPTGTSGVYLGGSENAAVWDLLFIYNTATQEFLPNLGESITPNADYTEWTLKLRPDITYSDGTPLDAQMVSDNIDRFYAAEGVRNVATGVLDFIETKTVVDDLTLVMSLNTPFAEFRLIFADEPGGIVNTNAIGSDLNAFRAMPPDAAGVGPYVVEKNIPGEETVLRARADYWGGPVCIERIRFVLIPTAQGTYDAFRNNEIDIAFLRDPIISDLAKETYPDANYFTSADGGVALQINHRPERITSDLRIRQAIAFAIDPTVISDRAFQGALPVAKSFYGPESRWFSDDIVQLPTDPERARKLVEEVKAEGWDGSLQLVFNTEGPAQNEGIAIEGMLNAVGFNVTLEFVSAPEITPRLTSGDFDAINAGFAAPVETGMITLSRALRTGSATNRTTYSNPALDELLLKALATPMTDLQPVLTDISNLINEDVATVVLGGASDGFVWNDRVVGLVPDVTSILMFQKAAVVD